MWRVLSISAAFFPPGVSLLYVCSPPPGVSRWLLILCLCLGLFQWTHPYLHQDFIRFVLHKVYCCSLPPRRFQSESRRAAVGNASPACRRLWPANSRKRRKKPRFDPQGAIPRQGIWSAEGTCVVLISAVLQDRKQRWVAWGNHLLIIWDNGPKKGATCSL